MLICFTLNSCICLSRQWIYMLIFKCDCRYINFACMLALVWLICYEYQDVRFGNCQYTKVLVHNGKAETCCIKR